MFRNVVFAGLFWLWLPWGLSAGQAADSPAAGAESPAAKQYRALVAAGRGEDAEKRLGRST